MNIQALLKAQQVKEQGGADGRVGELELAPRAFDPAENRMAATAPLQEAVAPQDLATGGDVNLVGGNMQPESALGGAAGVEAPSQDSPGNSIGEQEPEVSTLNPASEFARKRKDVLVNLGRQFAGVTP